MSTDKKRLVIGWAIFAVYIAVLLKLTVVRYDFLQHPLFSGGILNPPCQCLLEAFAEGRYMYLIYLIGGNIAAFVPFGFLIPFLSGRPKKLPMMLLYGFLLSVVVEFLQFTFGTGESEIDDLILNTLGAVIGFLLFKGFVKIKDKRNAAKTD